MMCATMPGSAASGGGGGGGVAAGVQSNRRGEAMPCLGARRRRPQTSRDAIMSWPGLKKRGFQTTGRRPAGSDLQPPGSGEWQDQCIRGAGHLLASGLWQVIQQDLRSETPLDLSPLSSCSILRPNIMMSTQ